MDSLAIESTIQLAISLFLRPSVLISIETNVLNCTGSSILLIVMNKTALISSSNGATRIICFRGNNSIYKDTF